MSKESRMTSLTIYIMSKKKKTLQLTAEDKQRRSEVLQCVLAAAQFMLKNAAHSAFDTGAAILCRVLLCHLAKCDRGFTVLEKELAENDVPISVNKLPL